MQDSIFSGIEAIEAILAPALGVSATALLLLSLQNRFSLIINRIRLLNEERRRLLSKINDNVELNYNEQTRQISVARQIQRMLERCRDVRNSILYIQFSILLFVLTSVLIAANLFVKSSMMRTMPLIIFVLGMLFVLIGIVYSAKDVTNSYRITLLDVKADE